MTAHKQDTNIGKYRLNKVIGAGGFGVIYQATDEQCKQDVVIKLINPEHANEPQFVQQFELEAEIMAQLDHKHIVSFYDYEQDANGAYLVMDWIDGDNLGNFIKNNTLSDLEIVRLMYQLASALVYLHEHKIVHRDLKPGNILIDRNKNVFLADFGISVDLKIQGEADVPSFILGSPAYLAPEQIVSKQVTPLGDIYSLGIVLYELLTCERPFRANSAREVLQMQMQNPLPSVRISRPDLPPELDLIIWKATAKRPEQRYINALDIVEDLESFLGNFQDVDKDYRPFNKAKHLSNLGNPTEIIDMDAVA